MDALDVLKNKGSEKLIDFSYGCDWEVTEKDKWLAEEYKIIEYRELANSGTENKKMFVKKSIANNRPVVIAMNALLHLTMLKKFGIRTAAIIIQTGWRVME